MKFFENILLFMLLSHFCVFINMTPVRIDTYDMNESIELRKRHRNKHRPCFRQDGRTFFQPEVTYVTLNYNCVSEGTHSSGGSNLFQKPESQQKPGSGLFPNKPSSNRPQENPSSDNERPFVNFVNNVLGSFFNKRPESKPSTDITKPVQEELDDIIDAEKWVPSQNVVGYNPLLGQYIQQMQRPNSKFILDRPNYY